MHGSIIARIIFLCCNLLAVCRIQPLLALLNFYLTQVTKYSLLKVGVRFQFRNRRGRCTFRCHRARRCSVAAVTPSHSTLPLNIGTQWIGEYLTPYLLHALGYLLLRLVLSMTHQGTQRHGRRNGDLRRAAWLLGWDNGYLLAEVVGEARGRGLVGCSCRVRRGAFLRSWEFPGAGIWGWRGGQEGRRGLVGNGWFWAWAVGMARYSVYASASSFSQCTDCSTCSDFPKTTWVYFPIIDFWSIFSRVSQARRPIRKHRRMRLTHGHLLHH